MLWPTSTSTVLQVLVQYSAIRTVLYLYLTVLIVLESTSILRMYSTVPVPYLSCPCLGLSWRLDTCYNEHKHTITTKQRHQYNQHLIDVFESRGREIKMLFEFKIEATCYTVPTTKIINFKPKMFVGKSQVQKRVARIDFVDYRFITVM